MKNHHIQYILYLIAKSGGTHLTNQNDVDFQIKKNKDKFAVYRFDNETNDWTIKLTKKQIIEEYIPFVFLATEKLNFRVL